MKGFVNISKYSGMREDLVQAGGGNSSFKISEEKMAIKASGYQLADITETDGYALVNPRIIKERFLGAENIDAFTDADSKSILADAFIEGKRPSIETFLHAISGTYTLHTHPIVVNALACRKNGMEVLESLFPDALMVPYATPGVELAKTYFKAYQQAVIDENHIFDVVFLQNHGLVVSADTGDAVIEKTEKVVSILEDYLRADYQGYHQLTEIWRLFEDKVVWKVTDENIIKAYQARGKIWQHAFCPDCVVFLGKKLLELSENFSRSDVETFLEEYGQPVMTSYRGNLYIIANSVKNAMETQSVMSFSAQVMKLNEGFECRLLSDDEQNFLLNWDAEKYRKNMK